MKPEGDSDSIVDSEFDVIGASPTARVLLAKKLKKMLSGLETQKRAKFQAVINRWCKGQSLTEEMINTNEGRTSRNNVRVQAFKTFKVRLYGFESTIDEMRSFLIVDIDPAKKQKKADPRLLDRAKKRADDLIDRLKGKDKDDGPR